MPLTMAAIIGGVLVATHHTKIPALTLPVSSPIPSPGSAKSVGSAQVAMADACLGAIPENFTGIAVKKQIPIIVPQFQKNTSTPVKVVEVYNPFPGSKFNAAEADQAIRLGALPLIQLNPRTVTMAQIASGAEDRYIKSYALAVKKFRCDVVLSLGHEMNGWWYHWGLPWTQPATFIAAWRHVHGIFATAGATNVIWSWDPSHQYDQVAPGKVASPASEWYPGNAYVDWVGVDGYLGQDRNGDLQNFGEIFSHQLASIESVAKNKLIYVAETGVAPGRFDVKQIAYLFAGLRQYKLHGVIWFEVDVTKKNDWRLGNRPVAAKAYGAEARSYTR